MSFRNVKSRKAVLAAMTESRHRGRSNFRTHYGFGEALNYIVRHEGDEYDSKPILAVAHKYQFPEIGPLTNDFAGGKSAAGRHLARLGFEVDGIELAIADWTLIEVIHIVSAYFSMMQEMAKGSLTKNEYIQRLEKKLPKRNYSSISRKLSNISAVLDKLGMPWLAGYAPLFNAQILLEAVVIDTLAESETVTVDEIVFSSPTIKSIEELELAPPLSAAIEAVSRARKACRVDFAGRDERNRNLGQAGEAWAVEYFRLRLGVVGRSDLAARVEWVSQSQGDGLGYDLTAFEDDGTPVFVEVKTTNGSINAPFVVSTGELAASSELKSAFRLMRIFQFSTSPKFYFLAGDLWQCCHLVPLEYRARPAISGPAH